MGDVDGQEDVAATLPVAWMEVRCYTKHRKLQNFIGRVPGGGKLPFGLVLTMVQAAVLGVGTFVMFETMPWWGPLVRSLQAPGYLAGLVGPPIGFAVMLRKPKAGGRWIWQTVQGHFSLLYHQLRDRSDGRQSPAIRPGRRVWVSE